MREREWNQQKKNRMFELPMSAKQLYFVEVVNRSIDRIDRGKKIACNFFFF